MGTRSQFVGAQADSSSRSDRCQPHIFPGINHRPVSRHQPGTGFLNFQIGAKGLEGNALTGCLQFQLRFLGILDGHLFQRRK